jgi:hypothetical protein
VVLVAALTAALLAVSAIAVYQFVRLRDSARDLVRPSEGGTGEGLGERLQRLVEELLGGGEGLGGAGPDLLACLSGQEPFAEEAAPAGGTLEQQVRAIARQVEGIRDLEFAEPVEPRFLPAAETADRVEDQFLEEYTTEIADAEERILAALGAVPAGIDLRQARAQALGSQVVGYYVPGTGQLVVQAEGSELDAVARVTLAHELEHALADQNLDLPIPLQPMPGREDRDLAGLAVIEGDATLTMQRYAFTLSFQDQIELADPSVAAEAEAGLQGLPYFLRQELLFPYQEGLEFVCRLYGAGGWEAVNEAYDNPPTSSAQILFPERFAGGEDAVDPDDPGEPRGSWSFEGRHELGAANLLWLFEAPGGDRAAALDEPMTGASAWAGGEAHLWERGSDSAVGISLAERAGDDVLCSAMSHWYAVAFPDAQARGSALDGGLELDGSAQDAVLRCTDHDVRMGIAPDLATANRLTG